MYPQQPQYPQSPGYPTPQYPAMPQYPPQPAAGQASQPGYYPQQPPAVPVQPTAAGSLDAFYRQPSTGAGKSLAFTTPGTSYVGIVTRPITDGDIQQQTDTQGRPAFFRDGRPKFVMKVPLQMQPTQEYPDGLAQWYVKGQARDELVRAMAEAGAPAGPPEAGAIVQVTFTGTRSSGPGMNPTKLFRVAYQRPQADQAPDEGAWSVSQSVVQPAPQPVVPSAPQPPLVAVPNPAPQPQPVSTPTFGASSPAGIGLTPEQQALLSPEQQALFAQLTGQLPQQAAA
jgi:hypothetical protein